MNLKWQLNILTPHPGPIKLSDDLIRAISSSLSRSKALSLVISSAADIIEIY